MTRPNTVTVVTEKIIGNKIPIFFAPTFIKSSYIPTYVVTQKCWKTLILTE